MFSLQAFASTTNIGTTLTNMVPVSDPTLAISGNFAFVPTLNQLIGVYGLGANLLRVQLSTPSLLSNVPLDVTPIDTNNLPMNPSPILMFNSDPIPLVVDEPLQVLATATQAGASDGEVFIFTADGVQAPVTGPIIRCRATTVTTGTKDAWLNSSLTLTNQLAEGSYNLVGARIEGSHVKAARFVFPGASNSTRPGMIASQFKYSTRDEDPFRNGNLGVWGTFSNRVLPTVDTLCDGTGETATLILDLIKTA